MKDWQPTQTGSNLTYKDKGKLIGLLAKDALKDYSDDTPAWAILIKEDQKAVTQRLNNYATRLVSEHLTEIATGRF